MRLGGLSCRRIRAKLEPGDAKAKRSWLRALAKKPEPPPVKRPSVAWEPGTAGTPEPEPSSASVKEPEVTRSLEWKQSGAQCFGPARFSCFGRSMPFDVVQLCAVQLLLMSCSLGSSRIVLRLQRK